MNLSERAHFEAWAGDQGFLLGRTFDGEQYQDLRTQGPWEAWQARAAEPGGDVLTAPAGEPTDEEIDACMVYEEQWPEPSRTPDVHATVRAVFEMRAALAATKWMES